VDAAIERLRAAGLLDDSAFARQFARSRVLGAGQSRRRVQQELYKRGVDREAIDGAVEEVFVDEQVDETELVEQAARKKLRTLERLDPAVRRRRLYGFLARRGYDGDAIRGVMTRLLSAVDAEAVDDLDGSELGDDEE
jgi:regulatory protein